MVSRKFFLFIFSFIFLVVTQIDAQTINIDEDAKGLQKTDKILLVYLHKTGCPYCERLEEFTFDDVDIENYINEHYEFRSFNVSVPEDRVIYNGKTMTNKEFSRTFGYGFYPVVIFMDSNKKIIHTSLGYVEDRIFMATLQYLTTKKYKEMSFDEYKKHINLKEEDE